jgi:hypothetical protein
MNGTFSDILLLEPPITVANHISSQNGRSLRLHGHASAEGAALGNVAVLGTSAALEMAFIQSNRSALAGSPPDCL